ncbi:hypothetical protein HDU93_004641 [Gonapodya sp. JEL0774]|nr:hypothetical protein HDU93_004641 [Gonapodya sp. JEL0774]
MQAQIQALQTTVHRLSLELARYQAKYPPLTPSVHAAVPIEKVAFDLSPNTSPSARSPSSTWLAAAKYLDPLFKAYDDKIAELEKKLDDEKSAHTLTLTNLSTSRHSSAHLASQVNSLTSRLAAAENQVAQAEERNKRLEEETQEARKWAEEAEGEIEEWEKKVEQGEGEVSSLRPALVASHRQLATLSRAHAALQARLSATRKELDETVANYERAMAEVDRWKGEARTKAEEARKRGEELESTLRDRTELISRLRETLDECSRGVEERKKLEREIKEGDVERADLTVRIDRANRRLTDLARAEQQWFACVEDLRGKLRESEEELDEAREEGRRSLEKVEAAQFAANQAQIREQAAKKECEVIRQRLKDAIEGFRERTAREVDGIKLQWLAEKRAASERIAELEKNYSEVRCEAERAMREGRAAASELSALRTHITSPQLPASDDLHSRLSSATRHLHLTTSDLARARSELAAAQDKWSREKSALETKAEEATKRARRAEMEAEECKRGEREALARAVECETSVTRDREEWETEREEARRRNKEGLESYADKVRTLEEKLAHTTKARDDATSAYQALMDQQRAIARRWEAEASSLGARYETAARDLRDKLERTEAKRVEAEGALEQATRLRDEMGRQSTLDRQLAMEAGSVARDIDARLREADRKWREAVGREKVCKEEKRKIMEELDRALLERDRLVREIERLRFGARTNKIIRASPFQPEDDSLRVAHNSSSPAREQAKVRADAMRDKLAIQTWESSEMEGVDGDDATNSHFLQTQLDRVKQRSHQHYRGDDADRYFSSPSPFPSPSPDSVTSVVVPTKQAAVSVARNKVPAAGHATSLDLSGGSQGMVDRNEASIANTDSKMKQSDHKEAFVR